MRRNDLSILSPDSLTAEVVSLLLRIIRESYLGPLSRDELNKINSAIEGQSESSKILKSQDRIKLAVYLGVHGTDILSISRVLDWHDFERLAATACEELGYRAVVGFRMKKPKTEIDVLAISEQVALCIDCKHWAKTAGQANMEKVARSQIERTRRFTAAPSLSMKPRVAVPVITTLVEQEVPTTTSGVPVVPITKFRDFVLGLLGNLENLFTICR